MDLLLFAIIFLSGAFAGATVIFWVTMPRPRSYQDYYQNVSNPLTYLSNTSTWTTASGGCSCGCDHAEGCPGEGATT